MQDLQYIDQINQDYETPGFKKSVLRDMMWLSFRGFLTNVKNPMALGIRLLTYCLMSAALGGIWYGIAENPKGSDQGIY